ncbi:hypothetical protein HYX19_00085, partial [Candidatus Woesearchaeota archaeon]|nr:hypothetical protein [Candidatus Woesearchaeota archaeon]
MEVAEQIERFRDILETNYKKEIHGIATSSKKSLVMDFMLIAEFEPELSELILSQPEDLIKAAEQALSEMDIVNKDIGIRICNLPPTQRILIRNVRSEHIDKFITFDGIIRQSSDVRPQVVSARFECPSCGNTISIIQLDTKFKEPSRCSCGRRGSFRLLKKDLVDAQRLVIEESPESLEGGEQPKRLPVFLKEDLVEPKMEKRTTPGSKVRVVGTIKEQAVMLTGGIPSVRLDLYADVNYIEPIEKTFEEFEVSIEDEKEIKELAKDPLTYERLIKSIAPSIYGHDGIKEALLLQLMGGVKKERPDGNITRGDMHILLVGDPGAAKCVHGDTRVNLSNGEIRNIKTIVEENLNENNACNDGYFKEVGFKLPSLDLNCKNKNNICNCVWKRTSPAYLYKIKTKTSNEIIVTPTQPMFVTNNGLVFSKHSKDLTVGEFIASPRRLELNTEIQKIDFTIVKTKANNGIHIKIPEYCDSNLGRFLGYIISESYVRHTDTSGETCFTNSNELLLQDFKNLAKSLFNVEGNSRLRRNKTFVIRITSIELLRFLEKIDESLLKNAKY